MKSDFWRVLSLLLILPHLVSATAISRYHAFQPGLLLPRQAELPDSGVACTTKCTLNGCGSGVCPAFGGLLAKRDLDVELLSNSLKHLNVTDGLQGNVLAKRIFSYDVDSEDYVDRDPTVNEAASYLPAVFDGGENDYFGQLLPLVSAQEDERAVSQQREFGNEPFQIMSGGLHGCTVLAVVSNRGVWMAHFWEVYSNGDWDFDSGPFDPNFYIEAFRDRVIRFMRGRREDRVRRPAPSNGGPYITPLGPSIDGNLFNRRDTDETQIFIMAPVLEGEPSGSTAYNYPTRINDMVQAVHDVLGEGNNPRLTVYGYQPLEYEDEADQALINTSQKGMALFQYDPDSNGSGRREWRLFLEERFARHTIPAA
ncbi:hypothetical protein B0I35DRAFT_434610 [Stachybotrys elegans]|uniref:Uncharacterized protein n=1 Tax=Stachybotrys elegans TaxID=80388 RepID=A0A8K0SRR4_9HYPO|nr:hypothetical protein B0I35DRAFT_434610 [Stachybotrys elegans]